MTVFDCHVHLPLPQPAPATGVALPEPAAILADLHDVGIDRAVCFPTFSLEPDNHALATFAADRDDVVPFAWLNPHLTGEGDKLRGLVADHGIKGVKLHPVLHGFAPDTPLLDPIMAAAVDLGVPVLVHSGHPMFATPWQVASLARAWPAATVVMEHMGLQLGWVDAAIQLAVEHPNLVLGVTAMPFFRKIRDAVQAVGPERVIWGSDAPALDAASELLRVRRCGLAPDAEAMVLGGSLAQLLREEAD
jgi:uncharacterized protein